MFVTIYVLPYLHIFQYMYIYLMETDYNKQELEQRKVLFERNYRQYTRKNKDIIIVADISNKHIFYIKYII